MAGRVLLWQQKDTSFRGCRRQRLGIAPHAALDLLRDWQEKGLELHSLCFFAKEKLAAEGYWHP